MVVAIIGGLIGLWLSPGRGYAAEPEKDATPPCKYEDGPGRCVWDAKHMGNGEGHSVLIRRDGTVVPITHRRAHRLFSEVQ
jgi:hypothetical protein